MVTVLSVLIFTALDYPFSIFTLLVTVLSVLIFTASDYPFSIFTLLVTVLSVLIFTLLITPLVSSHFWSPYCLSLYLRLLISRLVSSIFSYGYISNIATIFFETSRAPGFISSFCATYSILVLYCAICFVSCIQCCRFLWLTLYISPLYHLLVA